MAKRTKQPTETVNVRVEIGWGREFNGSYLAETPGRGCYVTVSECHPYGAGFSGCPLGRGESVEGAIADFIYRGACEYKGKDGLCRAMIVIADTRDNRKL